VISFRYHLVSLVAAFLALAVGIVIGSTLADRAIVDGLRSRVESVSANLDERQAANDRLQAENDRLSAYVEDGSGRFVADELTGQSVVVVVEQGVDGGAVDRTVGLLGEAGALVRARVDVRPDWVLDDPETRTELAAALNIERDDADAMRARLARLLVADLASTVVVSDDDSGPVDAATSLGLIDYDEVGGEVLEEGQMVSFVVITGTETADNPRKTDLASAMVAEGSPTVIATVFDPAAAEAEGTERGDSLAPILDDPKLAEGIATVDYLDLPEGPLTTVIVLADAIAGTVGHFGYGAAVDAAVPEPASA
jgi:hypothetical protein